MKQQFSTSWISSKQPRKQRKFRVNAPLHVKHKFLSANLSKPLRQKHGKRNLPVRKGDEVLVMRGTFKKKKAKVIEVDLKKLKISLEGIQRTKKDGTKVSVFFNPSSLQIQELNLEDKKRIRSTEIKKTEKKVETKTESKSKPKEKKNASSKNTSK